MSEPAVIENLTPPVTPTPGEPGSLIGQTPPATETPPTKVEEPAVEPAAAAEPVVPLTVDDIVVPDGFVVSDELKGEFVGILNNADLSAKDRAAALVSLQTKALTAASEASSAAWTDMQEKWKGEVQADPVVGGEKLQPALASINRLVKEYGTPELSSVFDMTGAGNNVHVIKFLSNIAGKLTEGSPAPGSPAGGTTSAAQRMFPSMKG